MLFGRDSVLQEELYLVWFYDESRHFLRILCIFLVLGSAVCLKLVR